MKNVMSTEPKKIRKSYRLNPQLVEFMEKYASDKRWTETTVIEYALELLAKKEGCELKDTAA